MNTKFKGTNIAISDSISKYIDRKVVRLVDKLFTGGSDSVSLSLEVEKTTRHHRSGKIFRAEANLSVGRKLLRAETLGENVFEAIDLLEEELEREIKKFKGRRHDLAIRGARKLVAKNKQF